MSYRGNELTAGVPAAQGSGDPLASPQTGDMGISEQPLAAGRRTESLNKIAITE